MTLDTVYWQQYLWQNHLPAKVNRQIATVRGEYDQLWLHLSCLAGSWFFCSNMNDMPLKWHFFSIKPWIVCESPGLSSCYHNIRNNLGYQLRLKKVAGFIFEDWLAHTQSGFKERERVEIQQNMKVFQIQRLLQWKDIISSHVNHAMGWQYIFVNSFKQNKRHKNDEN